MSQRHDISRVIRRKPLSPIAAAVQDLFTQRMRYPDIAVYEKCNSNGKVIQWKAVAL